MRFDSITLRSCALLLLACASLVGCKSGKAIGGDEPELPPAQDSDFPDAIRLSNGTVNLIVVPAIGGRIMRYGYVGAPNMLWNNPQAGKLREAAATRPSMNVNYGGDKAWPWPQDQWPLLLGRVYPPPAEADQAPFKSRLIGSHGVRLESPPIPSHGARIVREIRLDPEGTRVTIVTRLELATNDRPPPEIAAWAVTQVPGQAKLYARLLPNGATQPMQAGSTAMGAATTRPVGGRVIAIEPHATRAAKLGLDADILAAALGQTLFVQHSSTASAGATGYRRCERAQIFCQQADVVARDKKDKKQDEVAVPRYLELEFTSPRRDLAADSSPELRVTWDLHHGPPWNDEMVAVFLAADPASRPAPPADPMNRMPPMDVP